MAENDVFSAAAGAQPPVSGWGGRILGWLMALAEPDDLDLDGVRRAARDPDRDGEEDLRFAAFMSSPLY